MMRIDYSEQMVTWEWDGCVIKIELPDIIHAEYNKDENIVIVYSWENFVSKIIFYFSLEGRLLWQQNLLEGTLDWNHNGKHQISFHHLHHLRFSPKYQRIFSIFRSSSDFDVPSELEVYNLEGKKIDQIESPSGFTMLYISEISKKKLRIVCEALKEDCFDKSGRRDFYFNLELETRKWVKDGIAYWGRAWDINSTCWTKMYWPERQTSRRLCITIEIDKKK